MAASRIASRPNRIVVAYKATKEIDGADGRHYDAGDTIKHTGWTKDQLASAVEHHYIALVESEDEEKKEESSDKGGSEWQEL